MAIVSENRLGLHIKLEKDEECEIKNDIIIITKPLKQNKKPNYLEKNEIKIIPGKLNQKNNVNYK